jgi:hypothetical protein
MGKSIYMPYGAEDVTAQLERVRTIDDYYFRDGRHKPDHPLRGTYTGLYLKYYRAEGSSAD